MQATALAGVTALVGILASGAAAAAAAQECDTKRIDALRTMYLGSNVLESPIASRLADFHIDNVAGSQVNGPCERAAIRYQYLGEFFRGFRDADGFTHDDTTASSVAFKAGQNYRADNADMAESIYASFGYKPVKAEALWNPAWHSFRPIGAYIGELWERDGQIISSNYSDVLVHDHTVFDLHVRLTAYISPAYTISGVPHRKALIRELHVTAMDGR